MVHRYILLHNLLNSISMLQSCLSFLRQKLVHKSSMMIPLTPLRWHMNESVSKKKVPYPLSNRLKDLRNQYESGNPFPDHLVPVHDPDLRCRHGNTFNGADPVASYWVVCESPTIYKALASIASIARKVYYRPSFGRCGCKQEYDGQDELLLNVDNKNLFYYDFLFSYYTQ